MKIAILLAGFSLILASLFGLLTMPAHEHHGCPFMPSAHAMCLMDALDHVSVWQSFFFFLVPAFLIVFCCAIASVRPWPLEIRREPRSIPEEPEGPPPLQMTVLFSQGILHPKIFS